MRKLPEEYIIQKFYEYAKDVTYQKSGNKYNGGCPVCHEGESWGRKKRLYYYPESGFLRCFNCGKTWNAINWISEVSGLDFTAIWKEAKDVIPSLKRIQLDKNTENVIKETAELPEGCVNLYNKDEIDYFSGEYRIVKVAEEYMKSRRLDTAINKPKTLYVCLKDYTHKNRLVIPFCNDTNKIIWYQSRELVKGKFELPKYLSKENSDKSLYGLNSIDPDLSYLFLFEGPIDSMFVKNGLAIGGTNMSYFQKRQLDRYSFHTKIWVFDNDYRTNKEVYERAEAITKTEDRLFIWPKKASGYKDIAQLCQDIKRDSINPEFFIKNSYVGEKALIKLRGSLIE